MRTTMVTTIATLGLMLSAAVATADEVGTTTPPPSAAPPAPSGTVAVSAVGQPEASLRGVSVWGILPWNGIGVGGRFMLPLPFPSVLRSPVVKDAFALEFGVDFLHWSYGYNFPGAQNFNYSLNELVPVVGMMWSLWFNDRFALYPKVELGYAIASYSGWDGTAGASPTAAAFFWDIAAGALYKVGRGFTLRAEIGYAGLKLGAGMLF